jgi:preprotein translocase subunit SecA
MGIFNKVFGNANNNYLREIKPLVEKINYFESELGKISNEDLKQKTAGLKEALKNGKSPDDILPEAFALVREASKRTLNQRHFDSQLVGGIVLHQGKIAEMKTGEGKTLAATLPLFLNALEGKGAHLVTVNDYLAKRDAVWVGQIYDLLGLSVGCITHEKAFLYDAGLKVEESDKERDVVGGFKVVEDYLRPVERKEAYNADITYGTNNEFGFDYLRDNLVYDLNSQVQRGFNYAIVDEVDSILIDEARTPLIISAPSGESTDKYYQFARLAGKLKEGDDFTIDEKMKATVFTDQGQEKAIKDLGRDPWMDNDISTTHQLESALKALALFKKDRDYVVRENQVIIVDEFTGRLMFGRRWSGGLHQAVEAKEGVKVQEESKTFATVTFQNYFRLYKKLAGMTGTAITSAEEFDKVYKLEVIAVPTNKPMIRKDLPDRIYKSWTGKIGAVVKEIEEKHKKGQPVLVGTVSIEKNEFLGKLLEREGIPFNILNAKNHEKEGEIIAQAGKFGAVTLATNIAGRGVDIILGGNPPDLESQKKVIDLGGLHIVGTERHEARRIDNQLRGRSGRQGDPGSSQFFVSLEDDLMRIFGGDKIKSLMETFKIPEDQPIEANMISRAIESAQGKVEGMNFDLRKHILEYDDVMNKHREIFYRKRREVLELSNNQNNLKNYILEMVKKAGFSEEDYFNKQKEVGEGRMNELEKFVCLKVLDEFWLDHLENMDYLRDSVRLRAFGQQDPLIEYKNEGHKMFKQLLEDVDLAIANSVMKAKIQSQSASASSMSSQNVANAILKSAVPSSALPAEAPMNIGAKVGRNDPCPCGSGKKYKKCHGN